MSWMDRFKKGSQGQGDNETINPAESASHMTQQHELPQEGFRVRENLNTEIPDEDAGLPSVNRRKTSQKTVTMLGFLIIVGAAGAAFMTLDNDGPKKPVKAPAREVSNTLPPLNMNAIEIAPPPVQPIGVTSPGAMAAPTTVDVSDMGSLPPTQITPIPMQGAMTTPQAIPQRPTGPSIVDRKMGGSILVGGGNTGGTTLAPIAPSEASGMSGLLGGGTQSELALKLEPTQTNAVSASILPNRNFLLAKGAKLDCVLETAISSDVPGMVTCQLTRDIYSDNGHVLLLDRGSQLVGEYTGGMRQGQSRIFVLWTRAKTPRGVVVNLNSPGTDALGRAGFDGHVDTHFWQRFGAAIMMSLISDSASMLANQESGGSGGSGTTNNNYSNTANSGAKVVEKMLEGSASMPPTLSKNHGERIQVMVARDLDFSNVYGLEGYVAE